MNIGDKVIYIGKDSSGKVLTVEAIKRIECKSIPPYNRICAGWFNGLSDAGMVEAREDLFQAA